MMKNKFWSIVTAIATLLPIGANAQEVITSTFDAQKVLLPSSQYTPGEPYSAKVWVFNEGRRYNDADKNRIWATPESDAAGREWFQPGYELTDRSNVKWLDATAPFSSDEYYGGKKSFRWTTVDITAEIYMRRTFTLSSIPVGTIFLACGHDDAPAEWYINGTLVHSVADGWNNDEYILLSDEHKALLKADGSENVLAVHVHQNYGGAFADCGLYEANMSKTITLLPTVDDGKWPCLYYQLNYNDDISVAEKAEWYALDEDESDWVSGVGPFSNDENKFYITEWASQVRPILVRRHFNLSADVIDAIDESDLTLLCSYDENPKIWLNGTLIWSAGGWNDNNYAEVKLSADHKKLLREGDNVLAVSVMQGGGGGHIDYGLRLSRPYNPSDDTNGISNIETEKVTDNRVFNILGQYLGTSTENLPRGLYIVGGKKIITGK